MKVNEYMKDSICYVRPNTKIYEVVKLMEQNHIGCIPVCDDNNCLCGILTDRDILLRGVACNKDVNNTPVSEIMTTNVCTCNKDDDISNAQSTMSQNQIRRLPVCDNQNHVVGILTLGDIAQNTRQIGKQEVCTTIENICNCGKEMKNAE